MNENKLYDKLLDDLISHAAPIAIKEMVNEMDEPEPVEFSKEHEAKMKQLFKKERNRLRYKKILRHSKRVAIFIIILITVITVSIFSVEAWRIKVLNFIINMQQTHSEIDFNKEIVQGDSYISDEISFEYIPNGFKLQSNNYEENMLFLRFTNKEQYFRFSTATIEGNMGIDTENGDVKRVIINENEGIYSTNNNINILVWHDNDLSYTLFGNIKEIEMIKIAENINFHKK